MPDPADHTHLFLGTANGWIYESRTSGASWSRLAQIGKRDDLVLDSIVVDSSDPKHLLVGAWVLDRPDGGLYTSMDGGHSWTNEAEMRGQSVRALSGSPSNPQIFVAGSLSGVFRSIDSGRHWSRISPVESAEIHEIQSVAVDPMDPNVIYAGTWHLPWKTTDAGQHWASMKQGIIDDSDVFSIIVDPTSPKIVYASACSGIYKSEDAGDLFHKIQGIPSTARRTRVLLQDPHQLETVFAGTTEGLFRSNDAGATWTRTTGPEIIVNDVSIDHADSHHVLIATNRGGVLVSDDGGDTFHSSNGGFSARQITTLKRDREHPSTLFVGVVNDKDWGGVFESENGGVNWVQRSEGLEGRDVFSLGQAPDGTMIAGTAHGIFRLDGNDNAWHRVGNAPAIMLPVELARSSAPPKRTPGTVGVRSSLQQRTTRSSSTPQRKGPLPKPAKRSSASLPASSSRKVRSRVPQAAHVPKRRAQLAAGRRHDVSAPARLIGAVAVQPASSLRPKEAPQGSSDAAVYSIITAGQTLLAATSDGLLSSTDNGSTWIPAGPQDRTGWRLLASAKSNVVAGGLHTLAFSSDAGATWSPMRVPEQLTQASALAVEPSGTVWVGSREGVFVSSDAGNTWSTPKDLYANPVNNIFYDEAAGAMTITTAGVHGVVFTVQLPHKSVAYYEAGWTLRFAYPVGDHLVAATLFDGLVIQPKTTVSAGPELPSHSSVTAIAPVPSTKR